MPGLFEPYTIRGKTFKNRIFVSPMCQYSADSDGLPGDWHLVHLGRFSVGGAGLILTEATAVSPEGRLSPRDTGMWAEQHVEAWGKIVRFLHDNDTLVGMQLVHAGRKGSTSPPWSGEGSVVRGDGGWETVAPSAIPFDDLPPPRELSQQDINAIRDDFTSAADRARRAGFDVLELHAAHGYLLHQFLSPLSNTRSDSYGADFVGRTRLLREVVESIRASAWPAENPLFVRVSVTDWVDGGWDVEQTVQLASELGRIGVDLVDCSSGGLVPNASIPVAPGYQVPFAKTIRHSAGIATGAVGRITQPKQADEIVRSGAADAVFMAKELLRQPMWPLLAAGELGEDVAWPRQYETSKPN